MSLQVWLPLIENHINQGIANMNFTTTSTFTISNQGKLGKCYSFDASGINVVAIHDKTIWNNKPISLACWFKVDSNKK